MRVLINRWLPQPFALSPWATWTLFSLIRHRQRQAFVAEIVRDRVGVRLEHLARRGYDAHPPDKGHGVVPGLADWDYNLHGRGCCVIHRLSGVEIDVDFFDDTSDWFEPYFYQCFLSTLKEPELWEKRLIELHPQFSDRGPTFETIRLAFADLQEAGFLESHSQRSSIVKFAFDEQTLSNQMAWFETAAEDRHRLIRLAAVIGDWPLVCNLQSAENVEVTVAEAARQVIALREQKLIRLFEEENRQRLALKGLQEIDSLHLDEYIITILKQGMSTADTALEMLLKRNDKSWCPLIHEFYQQFNPAGSADEFPSPEIWGQCLEFLFRHQYPFPEAAEVFSNVHQYCLGEAVVLALMYQRSHALRLLRAALRSEIPNNRMIAAAVLALIDQPWSREELLSAFSESEELAQTAECRAALLETQCSQAHQIVSEWQARHPVQRESDEWMTVEEMNIRSLPVYLQWEMDDLRERIVPLRNVVLPDFENE
ncbi:MAG: hypothetical protein KDA70_19295 [Planctomycetaceae bacterium]|nr:hypothetical protein [Planctomycetaceae bacterium]